jgi:hypothetical protein
VPPVPLPRNGVVAAATAIACGLGVAGVAEASATGDEVPVASATSALSAPAAGITAASAESGPVAEAGPLAMAGSSTTDATIRVIAQPRPSDAVVAGLSRTQMDNARVIVEVGRSMGLPERAYVIAVACALQESSLRNLANDSVAESFAYPHDGRGADHDSVGLFQQRPSAGWGSVEELMQPVYSARRFYRALARVRGWRDMPLTRAAQAVQHSAFPDAYARHEARAQRVVDAL